MEGYGFPRGKGIITPGLNLVLGTHFFILLQTKVSSCLEGESKRIRNDCYIKKADDTHSVFPFAGKLFQSFKNTPLKYTALGVNL